MYENFLQEGPLPLWNLTRLPWQVQLLLCPISCLPTSALLHPLFLLLPLSQAKMETSTCSFCTVFLWIPHCCLYFQIGFLHHLMVWQLIDSIETSLCLSCCEIKQVESRSERWKIRKQDPCPVPRKSSVVHGLHPCPSVSEIMRRLSASAFGRHGRGSAACPGPGANAPSNYAPAHYPWPCRSQTVWGCHLQSTPPQNWFLRHR